MTYGIVGLGRFGSALAMDLASAGAEIVVSFDPHSFQTTITFLIIGSILTMCVQSSADRRLLRHRQKRLAIHAHRHHLVLQACNETNRLTPYGNS